MRRSSSILLGALLIYGLGLIATFLLFSDWTARQTGAVVLTGAVVIWYTWETMLLREVAVAQREYQVRPFIVFKGGVDGYLVENIGASPALGINIKSVEMQAPGFCLCISFPTPVAVLRSGEASPIETEVVVNGRTVETVFAAHLDPKYAVEDIDLHISFRSIEGKNYSLIQTTSPKSTTIKGFRDKTDAL